MKRFIKTISLVLACAALIAFTAGCGSGNSGGTTSSNQKTIAVIAKGETNAFWQSVKAGAEDAAKKYGYKLTFRGPESESPKDLPSQKEMLQTALSNNASAIVIGTIGEGFSDSLKQAYDRKIPVVELDSGIWENDIKELDNANKNPIVSSVATSNKKAAALAAEKFFEAIKSDIAAEENYVVGVIQFDETQSGIDRAAGFIDKFTELANADETTKNKFKIEKEVKPGDANNAYKDALEALYEKGAKSIFMANEAIVKQVYDAISSSGTKYENLKFYGFDAGTKQIEWMKKDTSPKLIGSVAQDSYQIGYKAVEQAVFAIEQKEVAKQIDIDGKCWDLSNLELMMSLNIVYQG